MDPKQRDGQLSKVDAVKLNNPGKDKTSSMQNEAGTKPTLSALLFKKMLELER